MEYKSDNSKYPDPKNIFEWIILQVRNLFDKEYQESKARYMKLHRFDGVRYTRKGALEQAKRARKQMRR